MGPAASLRVSLIFAPSRFSTDKVAWELHFVGYVLCCRFFISLVRVSSKSLQALTRGNSPITFVYPHTVSLYLVLVSTGIVI